MWCVCEVVASVFVSEVAEGTVVLYLCPSEDLEEVLGPDATERQLRST